MHELPRRGGYAAPAGAPRTVRHTKRCFEISSVRRDFRIPEAKSACTRLDAIGWLEAVLWNNWVKVS